MKNTSLFLLLFVFSLVNAQNKQGIKGETNWFEGLANFKPKTTEYSQNTKILAGNISENTTLTKKYVYLLTGTVRVIKNAVLTIESGTLIRGDFETCGALIITKGAKIMALGSEFDPIVFTSNKLPSDRKAGDWGGLIILGDAPTNTHGSTAYFPFDINPTFNVYGGKNENDSSGILKFVRVEFGGKKDINRYSPNGISLAGVGNKTIIENICVSNSLDDSFQIYGGNVTLNNVISYLSKDDDFEITQGSQCTINNGIAIRDPYVSGVLRSRCFEIETFDNIENYDATKKETLVKLNNVTMVNVENNDLSLVKESIFLNENTKLEISKSVVTGFSSFIAFNEHFYENETYKKIKIADSTVDSCSSLFSDETLRTDPTTSQKLGIVKDWFLQSNNNITQSSVGVKNMFINNDVKNNPDFRLK
jgi:hypothetical protein